MNYKNSKTTPSDWLTKRIGADGGTCCISDPPQPISGPIESHHDPDLLLSSFRDEKRWSAGILAWVKKHPFVSPPSEEEAE
jgi:hypothetical protein